MDILEIFSLQKPKFYHINTVSFLSHCLEQAKSRISKYNEICHFNNMIQLDSSHFEMENFKQTIADLSKSEICANRIDPIIGKSCYTETIKNCILYNPRVNPEIAIENELSKFFILIEKNFCQNMESNDLDFHNWIESLVRYKKEHDVIEYITSILIECNKNIDSELRPTLAHVFYLVLLFNNF